MSSEKRDAVLIDFIAYQNSTDKLRFKGGIYYGQIILGDPSKDGLLAGVSLDRPDINKVANGIKNCLIRNNLDVTAVGICQCRHLFKIFTAEEMEDCVRCLLINKVEYFRDGVGIVTASKPNPLEIIPEDYCTMKEVPHEQT